MADAQLVDGVRVRRGEVGDDEVGVEQQLVHRLVYEAGVDDGVGADALQPGLLDGPLDDDAVGLVEVEHAAGGEVGLGAEPHDDETSLLRFFL